MPPEDYLDPDLPFVRMAPQQQPVDAQGRPLTGWRDVRATTPLTTETPAGLEQSHGNGGATIAGVILGGIAGNSIAGDMDCNDRHYALTSYSAGFEGRIGDRHDWRNGRNRGSFTPTREYSRGGNTCRDFQEASYRNGRDYSRNGTAWIAWTSPAKTAEFE